MKYYQIHIILMALLLCSCHSLEKPKKPEDLISKQKMADILEDVYILNAAKGTNREILETNGRDPEAYILKKYGVDSLQFAQSNDYYAFDVKAYEEIVGSVKERLTILKDSLSEQLDIEKERQEATRDSLIQIRDSINAIKKDSLSKLKGVKQFN